MAAECDTVIEGAIEGGQSALLHATALAIGHRGVIIRGSPGAGKSDLALRALTAASSSLVPWAVRLVADDQVQVARTGGAIMMSCPAAIAAKLEVRGIGIVDLPAAAVATGSTRLVLVVDLTNARDWVERMPARACVDVLGLRLACLKLYPFEGSAALKLVLAVMAVP